jgi:hypothetical protein
MTKSQNFFLKLLLRGCSQTPFTRRGRYLGGQKFLLFVNIYTIDNVNAGG